MDAVSFIAARSVTCEGVLQPVVAVTEISFENT